MRLDDEVLTIIHPLLFFLQFSIVNVHCKENKMPCKEKIVIIGSAGAGKTTFARRLGKILDIEVFHLDRYFWGEGWREKSPSERKKI